MNIDFARTLCRLNNSFYRTQAESFSETRHSAWEGWQRCCNHMSSRLQSSLAPLHLLDVACGNLRFESFLAKHLLESHASSITVRALDACDGLVANNMGILAQQYGSSLAIEYQHCDIIDSLATSPCDAELLRLMVPQDESLPSALFDLEVTFGFMHHIPLPAWRNQLLSNMIATTITNGIICVSFWRFMDNPNLAAKAQKTHRQGCAQLGFDPHDFNQNDFLIGWNNAPGVYRYCHSFNDADIDQVIAFVQSQGATVIDRFRADGRTHNLNEYLVLQKN